MTFSERHVLYLISQYYNNLESIRIKCDVVLFLCRKYLQACSDINHPVKFVITLNCIEAANTTSMKKDSTMLPGRNKSFFIWDIQWVDKVIYYPHIARYCNISKFIYTEAKAMKTESFSTIPNLQANFGFN